MNRGEFCTFEPIRQIAFNFQGGGVLFYAKSRLGSEPFVEFTLMTAHVETIFVSFSFGAKKYTVGNFHRPPGASVDLFNTTVDNLREILSRFDNSSVMLVGDFNIDLFKVGRFSI